MKNFLALTFLALTLSFCNLTERLANKSREQDNGQSNSQNSNQSNTSTSSTETEEPPPPPPPAPEANRNSAGAGSANTVSGGLLNDKAISLPRPTYPPMAKAARASGKVVVQVIVDETGKVTSATAVSGHPLLQNSAVQAAYQARFAPTKQDGKPVKVSGTITYDFQP